jgi:hypothetical protein
MMQPNFSGLWQADLSNSHMSEPPPAKLMMKIAHGEEDLRQAILIEWSNGTHDRQVLTYSMTGAQSITELRGLPLKSKVLWNGPEMVIEATYGESVLRDYWSLSKDRLTLTMAHRNDILAGQITVFERADNT